MNAEESAEREATLKAIHVPMRQWYNASEQAPLKEEHGEYPAFWQELRTWGPEREVERGFLRWQSTQEASSAEAVVAPSSSDTDAAGGTRRKRSRWGTSDADNNNNNNDDDTAPTRKSRWTSETDESIPSQPPPFGSLASLQNMPVSQQRSVMLRLQIDEVSNRLTTVEQDALIADKDPNRSPSPMPTYDASGKRTNTRVIRWTKRLTEQREQLVEELLRLNPSLRPEGMRAATITRKIYVPVKDFPNFNFVGIVIGPRGNTQKRLEKETGCKIGLRGKGSVKSGRRGAARAEESQEDLHVLITGEDEEAVEKASKEVEKLLRPIDDDLNEHKQKQLRELAVINGTLRQDNYCTLCGEPGHRQFECPTRGRTEQSAGVNVMCKICGEVSHPTSDCPRKRTGADSNEEGGGGQQKLDEEYLSFMEEVAGEAGGKASSVIVSSSSSSSLSTAPSSSSISSSSTGNVAAQGMDSAGTSTPISSWPLAQPVSHPPRANGLGAIPPLSHNFVPSSGQNGAAARAATPLVGTSPSPHSQPPLPPPPPGYPSRPLHSPHWHAPFPARPPVPGYFPHAPHQPVQGQYPMQPHYAQFRPQPPPSYAHQMMPSTGAYQRTGQAHAQYLASAFPRPPAPPPPPPAPSAPDLPPEPVGPAPGVSTG